MSANTRQPRPVNSFVATQDAEKNYIYGGTKLIRVGHWKSTRSRIKTKVGNDVDLYYVPSLKAIAYMWDDEDTRFVLIAPQSQQAKYVRIFWNKQINALDRAWLKLFNYQVLE